MTSDLDLVDRIYEASVMTERWPDVLQCLADRVGAKGAIISMRTLDGARMMTSPKIADDVQGFVEAGWADDPAYTAPLYREQWPGFRAETHYRSEAELAALPVHRDYLDPRGFMAAVATVIPGARHDHIHLAVEGFPSHEVARGRIAMLDPLRADLARAISLTALRGDRSRLVVDSLALAGVAAAVIAPDGRLRAANAGFAERMGKRMADLPGGLRFADTFLMRNVMEALGRQRRDRGRVQSVAVRGDPESSGFALHLLPIVGTARDACGGNGVLLLLAEPANVTLPSSDLLRLLFDLTPAEARVARRLVEGDDPAGVSAALGVSPGTVRVHLRAVFAKTGVNRQADLVRLLATLGPPVLGLPSENGTWRAPTPNG